MKNRTFCSLWRVPALKELPSVIGTWCLAVMLTPWPVSELSFLLLPLRISGISLPLKAPMQKLFPEKQVFKFPCVQPERGACCCNQHCRVQPASSPSSSVTSLSDLHQLFRDTFFFPPRVLSDRFLASTLSPWRVLNVWHSCYIPCSIHCLDVSHFIVWNSPETLGYEALQELVMNEVRWERSPSSLLTCSGFPWTEHSPVLLHYWAGLASHVWNSL